MRPLQAVIDLSAIAHNLGMAKRLSGNARIAAAVKANAYGHGLTAVLPALAQADWFAVASVDEAMAIRACGNFKPVLLLEGVFEPDEYALCAEHRFEPVIHHPSQMEMLEKTTLSWPIKPWIKLDTGMHRLGLTRRQFQDILARLSEYPMATGPFAVMTHMASADEAGSDFSERQWDAFNSAVATLDVPKSAANSAALMFQAEIRADIIRPGIMLYGAGPDWQRHGCSLGLKPAMRLTTKVIALREIEEGQAVGYGGTWCAKRPSMIATAAVGYGDGYPRAASANGMVMVKGHEVPLAGRVSMDMIGIDVTEIPNMVPGDEVVLWGPELPVERLAQASGTISYELLCGVTDRVPRRCV